MLEKFWNSGHAFSSLDAVYCLFWLLRSMGMHPPQTYRALYFLYGGMLFFIVCIVAPITFNVGIFLESLSTAQLLTLMQAVFNVWGIPLKAVTVALYVPRLRSTEQYMAQLDARCERKDEQQLIRKLALVGNGLVIFYGTVFLLYGMTSYVLAFGAGHPMYALYLFVVDWRNSTAEFYWQAAIEFVVIFWCIYFQVAQDVYPAVYIAVLRAHMHILEERVRRLGTDPQKSGRQNFDELVQCIGDHQCLLKLYKTVSSAISITMFIQFAVTSAILSTTMINIVFFADTGTKIGSAIYLTAVLVQTLPTCYQASMLQADSEKLPVAIFHCNWIDQDVRFRKMCIFFMQNTQVPMTLAALKFYPITLNTNWNIIKFSFSLFTLLRNADLGHNH